MMLPYLLLGYLTGALSGMLGIGGGSFLTPALIYFFGFSQHIAQGTTLALMVPPIGLIAAWKYYRQGYVDMNVSFMISIGFLLGSLLGAKLAIALPELYLKRIFSVLMFFTACKMMFSK